MSHTTVIAPERRGRRRRIVALASIAIVAGLVGIGAIPRSDAGALPVPPVPPTNPTSPPTIPTTLGTAPPDPDYIVNVLLLNQDTAPGAAPLGAVSADRSWLPDQIIAQGAAAAPAAADAGPIGTIFDPIPAGTSTLRSNNTFAFPAGAMPSGNRMILRVREAGVPGSLCRTNPVKPMPATGTYLHLLVAPPVSTNAAALDTMAQGFKGLVPNTPTGVVAVISTASLVPRTTGLVLHITGLLRVTIFGTTITLGFDYTVPLTLVPLNGTDPNYVLNAQATNSGTLTLGWFQTPPPNGDAFLEAIKPTVQAQLKSSVVTAATPAVNNAAVLSHDVKWWTEQGFTLSVRKVTYTNSALIVSGALCRLG